MRSFDLLQIGDKIRIVYTDREVLKEPWDLHPKQLIAYVDIEDITDTTLILSINQKQYPNTLWKVFPGLMHKLQQSGKLEKIPYIQCKLRFTKDEFLSTIVTQKKGRIRYEVPQH